MSDLWTVSNIILSDEFLHSDDMHIHTSHVVVLCEVCSGPIVICYCCCSLLIALQFQNLMILFEYLM